MTDLYVLHYAPDNASLIIRLLLEEMGLTYRTALVDRASRQQDSAAYKALNPAGLIPVLETTQGPIAETAAIALWLSETHGQLASATNSDERGAFLQTLFFLANTVHADLRVIFYPEQYAGADVEAQKRLHVAMIARFARHLDLLNDRCGSAGIGGAEVTICDYYLAVMLRWSALYARHGADWFDLSRWPNLRMLCERLETRPAVHVAAQAEGLGTHPFSRPQPAQPKEGSALG